MCMSCRRVLKFPQGNVTGPATEPKAPLPCRVGEVVVGGSVVDELRLSLIHMLALTEPAC